MRVSILMEAEFEKPLSLFSSEQTHHSWLVSSGERVLKKQLSLQRSLKFALYGYKLVIRLWTSRGTGY